MPCGCIIPIPEYPASAEWGPIIWNILHGLAEKAQRAALPADELREWVSAVTGTRVQPTPDQDQSSLSLLCYREAGDHINWHYDHNFYRGRHFTVLLSLANESLTGGISQSQLMRKTAGNEEKVDTSANVLVLFEGAKVLHRASPTAKGDLRIMLSMTFCTDPRISPFKEVARRFKDTAFYGIRALWD